MIAEEADTALGKLNERNELILPPSLDGADIDLQEPRTLLIGVLPIKFDVVFFRYLLTQLFKVHRDPVSARFTKSEQSRRDMRHHVESDQDEADFDSSI